MGTLKRSIIAAPFAASALIALFAINSGAEAGTTQTLVTSDPASFVPAKLVPTDMENRHITNHCIEAGRTKADCVCLTKIMKYELSVGDYRNIANRVKPSESRTPTLAIDRYRKKSDRPTIPMDPVLQTIIDSAQFSQRCLISDEFFMSR